MPRKREKFLKSKFTDLEKLKIDHLLSLSDYSFYTSEVGHKIRENFRQRGWLKNKPRGNASKGAKNRWEKERLKGGLNEEQQAGIDGL